MIRRLICILAATAYLAAGAPAQELPALELVPPYSYRFTVGDRLLAAQACVHEATWAGAELTGDCGGILQVVMERRHRGETFAEALSRTMPRFYAGATSRSWTRHLPSGPLRVDPEGWPYDYPARAHDEAWLGTNRRVQAYMRGAEPLPCSPPPRRWFGRTTDGAALAATLAEGRWCEARCGESRNAFLVRCGASGVTVEAGGRVVGPADVDPE